MKALKALQDIERDYLGQALKIRQDERIAASAKADDLDALTRQLESSLRQTMKTTLESAQTRFEDAGKHLAEVRVKVERRALRLDQGDDAQRALTEATRTRVAVESAQRFDVMRGDFPAILKYAASISERVEADGDDLDALLALRWLKDMGESLILESAKERDTERAHQLIADIRSAWSDRFEGDIVRSAQAELDQAEAQLQDAKSAIPHVRTLMSNFSRRARGPLEQMQADVPAIAG